MHIQTIHQKTPITISRSIDYVAINSRLVLVHTIQVAELNNPKQRAADSAISRGQFAPTVHAMVLTNENFKKFRANKPYKEENLLAVTPAFLEDARTKGYASACSEHGPENNLWAMTALQNDVSLSFVRFDEDAEMLFDEEDRPLPVALHFSGPDEVGILTHDLALARKILRKHKNVSAPLDESSIEVLYPDGDFPPCETAYIDFVFSPTKQQMHAIWKQAKKMYTPYPSFYLKAAVLKLDLLGLRSAEKKKARKR